MAVFIKVPSVPEQPTHQDGYLHTKKQSDPRSISFFSLLNNQALIPDIISVSFFLSSGCLRMGFFLKNIFICIHHVPGITALKNMTLDI